ncbi:ribonuclease HIII [Mycoplasma zalophidermidis]|uniref:Ribonuclease n=1 Tax=Mycoplasma zalophidermidis TaxID=398174 RepID=A0ABS6DR83_9MOLU|nr:ribonuclease HIII [Mycoplasma zalophidermidis]MBU4689599.1 ribonuclease HIII [Mycoplasma zalophidermidis]MBU4693497.1 ribonuclease HIII [Mycoplasma zalophidermidis]MCR8966543.1 ribonuclease HIII [Mycoplasma zalophidermidis]
MNFIEFNSSLNVVDKRVIGVDEVGVGDYFGPLVSAAVLIPQENKEKLIKLGVIDSKKISDTKIKVLAPQIRKLCVYGVYVLSPKGFNNMSKMHNGNELKMFTHLSSIDKVLVKNNEYDFIFIDKYSTTNCIQKYYDKFMNSNFFVKFTTIKKDIILANKAEDISLEVACASILARETFLYKMEEMNQKYGIQFPFGASQKVKEFAKELFEKRSDIVITDICKTTFKMEI